MLKISSGFHVGNVQKIPKESIKKKKKVGELPLAQMQCHFTNGNNQNVFVSAEEIFSKTRMCVNSDRDKKCQSRDLHLTIFFSRLIIELIQIIRFNIYIIDIKTNISNKHILI